METPILDMLNGYRRRGMRFHVPGHKGRLPILGKASKYDITELAFSDDLFAPRGVLAEAERLCAKAYGAERCKFITCGATFGVQTALAVFAGRPVLADRYSHASFYRGAARLGIEPVLFNGRVTDAFPVARAGELERAIPLHPEAAAVFVTSPNYYGQAADVARLAEVAHRAGLPLIVDASHGSHFAFSPLLPPNPAEIADMTVLSMHKTGLALTQGAAVCVNGAGLYDCFLEAWRQTHTTSPSYLILSTIDFSRAFMVQYYRDIASRQREAVARLSARLAGTGFALRESDDFTRLVVDVASAGVSGFAVEQALNGAGVFPEFADGRCVVFVLSATDRPGHIARLGKALVRAAGLPRRAETAPRFDFVPERCLPYLFKGKTERVPVEKCGGRISAADVGLYPPGVPLVLRGERIPEELTDIFCRFSNRLFGAGESIEVAL